MKMVQSSQVSLVSRAGKNSEAVLEITDKSQQQHVYIVNNNW